MTAFVRAFALAAVSLSFLTGFTSGVPKIDDPEVTACFESATPEKSLSQTLRVHVSDETGTISDSEAEFFWKKLKDGISRALIRFTEPPQRAGTAVLVVENDEPEPDMFLYLPELRVTRRVTGKTLAGSMLGTDFSYEDFAHFQGIAQESETKRVEDRDLDGRPAFVLETTPLDEESAYQKIITYIDREQCLPVKTEFIAQNGSLRKELVANRDAIKQVGEIWIPHMMVMRDLKQKSRTEIEVIKVKVNPKLRDRFFDAAELESR